MQPTLPPFLKRLFRYRQTSGRTPTEDFLSEVVADFLSRAPQAVTVQFVLDCFVPQAMASRFRLVVGDRALDVRTQVHLPNGKILDILIEVDGRPLLVIENKIGAAFQQHARNDADEEDGADVQEAPRYHHQLLTYGSWLRDADKPEGWPGVLTVLTHAALVPPDFQASSADRYGAVPHCCYWRSFHGKLRGLVGDDENDPVTPAWMFVGREMCRFLESNDMNASNLTSVDIAAINVSMEPTRRSAASFMEIGFELQHRFPEHLVARSQSSSFEPENGRMWGWTYFAGQQKVYVGYGVYFTPLVGGLTTPVPPLPDQEHAFIAVGSDKTALQTANFDIPAEWSCVFKGWCVMKPVSLSARTNGERFPQFFIRLIENEFASVLTLRDAYQASLPPTS